MKLLGGRGALVIAVALGSVTSFLVWQYVQQLEQRPAAVVETTPVVVAARAIPPRTVVTPEMVRVQSLPVEARHPSAFRSPGEVIGKITRSPLTTGEQVLTTKVYLQREDSGLAFMVPDGMRAVSVGFNEVIGTGGMILPGDRVDVIGVFEVRRPLPTSVVVNTGDQAVFQRSGSPESPPRSPSNGQQPADSRDDTAVIATVVLQDVEVLAVAQRVEGEDTRPENPNPLTQQANPNASNPNQQTRSQPPAQPGAKTATFAVSPDDALRLVLAEDRGKIRLALRRSKDTSVASAESVPFEALIQNKAQ